MPNTEATQAKSLTVNLDNVEFATQQKHISGDIEHLVIITYRMPEVCDWELKAHGFGKTSMEALVDAQLALAEHIELESAAQADTKRS